MSFIAQGLAATNPGVPLLGPTPPPPPPISPASTGVQAAGQAVRQAAAGTANPNVLSGGQGAPATTPGAKQKLSGEA